MLDDPAGPDGPGDIPDYFVAERPEFAAFIRQFGPFGSALDIGCAGGVLGTELLRSGVVGACDGIEPNPEAAGLARSRLRQVWNGALESNRDQVSWKQYDLVIMADVLEHLVDPWAALRFLKEQMRTGSRLALSVPNVRHYKVLLPLLFRGEFRYRDQGIMDRTHLHFFTRGSLSEALDECGWRMLGVDTHMKRRYRRWYYPTRFLEPFVAVQYLVMAEKK